MIKNICSLITASILIMACKLGAIEYDIQDIGTLQTKESHGIAINNQGQILGWYNIDGTAQGKHFFVRDRDGTFHEIDESIIYKDIPQELREVAKIDWRFLTDDGRAYGTFDNRFSFDLIMWDQKSGAVNLGKLPGSDVKAINNRGQVLISSVITTNSEGKQMRNPVIWESGEITKLKGLEGDLGIESEESYGVDMNNNGEVVGQSLVSLNYKNEIYKQVHAVKWTNGKAVDVHNKVPKSLKTHAIAINDLGEVLIYAGETREYLPKYLIRNDGGITVFSYDLNKLNNAGYVFNCDYDYGVPVIGVLFGVWDRNGKDIFHSGLIMMKIQNDSNSIWTGKLKLIEINDNNEMIVQGKTIYGEEHAMLLTPVAPK